MFLPGAVSQYPSQKQLRSWGQVGSVHKNASWASRRSSVRIPGVAFVACNPCPGLGVGGAERFTAALEGEYRREKLTTTFPRLWLKGIPPSLFSPSPSLPLPLPISLFLSFSLSLSPFPSLPILKLLTLSILAEGRQRREGQPPSLQWEEQSSPGKSVKYTVSQQREGGGSSSPRRNGTWWDQHTNIFLGGVRGTAFMWPQAAEGETRWGLSPELPRDNLEKGLLCAAFQGPSLIPGFSGSCQRKNRKQKHFGLWCWIYCLEKEES